MSSILNHPARNEAFGEPDGDDPRPRKERAMDALERAAQSASWIRQHLLECGGGELNVTRLLEHAETIRSALAQPAPRGEAVAWTAGSVRDAVQSRVQRLGLGTFPALSVPVDVLVAMMNDASPALGERQRAFYEAAKAVMADRCDCNDGCVSDELLEREAAAYAALPAAERGEAPRE